MMPRRLRREVCALILVVAAAVAASCSTVASVFLDLPEKSRQAPEPVRPATLDEVAVSDTVRPPIEATLDPDEVLALLPRDQGGNVDWMAALHEGVIKPRRALPGAEPPPDLDGFRFDFLLKGPNRMFDAAFPHSAHVEWLACESCHTRIFPYRNEPLTMKAVNKGEACGECHGTVAFPATACYKCHTAIPPGEASPHLVRDITFARRADTAAQGLGADAFPPASFPHWVHRIRYRCMACHPSPFEADAGANTITMAGVNAGRACGACHDGSTTFGVLSCNRCHISAEAGQGFAR